jgi:hypothetical protein
LPFIFEDTGVHAVENITEPVNVYRLLTENHSTEHSEWCVRLHVFAIQNSLTTAVIERWLLLPLRIRSPKQN